MKEPLGYMKYFKGNRKIVLRYIATLLITAVILGIIEIIIANSSEEISKMDCIDTYAMSIQTRDEALLDNEKVQKIKDLDSVKYVIPTKSVDINYQSFISSPSFFVDYMSKEDMKKYMDCLGINYDEDKIENLKENEVITTDRLVKNKKLKDGDAISKFLEDLKYKESFDSHWLVAFTPMDFNYGSNQYLIIPKDTVDDIKNDVRDILDGSCTIESSKEMVKRGQEATDGTFNAVKIIITLTCAIATGVTTFIHYYNRRKEIGVLKAIGYSDKKIIFRITKEILISSIIALLCGIALMYFIVFVLNKFLNQPSGYLDFAFNISMLSNMTVVILSIMIFSLVPTWVLLKGVDKVSLVEGRA